MSTASLKGQLASAGHEALSTCAADAKRDATCTCAKNHHITPWQTSRNAGRGIHTALRVSLFLAGLKASVFRGKRDETNSNLERRAPRGCSGVCPHVNSVQGYLQDGFADSIENDAEGFSQRRTIDDVYLNSIITQSLSPTVAVSYGINEVFGHARQGSSTFPYTLPLDGTAIPLSGVHASITGNYVGPRYLDIQNTVRAGGYLTEDASIGYSFERALVTANAYNLTNRRDPALESELGEGQLYRVKGRWLQVKVTVPFR